MKFRLIFSLCLFGCGGAHIVYDDVPLIDTNNENDKADADTDVVDSNVASNLSVLESGVILSDSESIFDAKDILDSSEPTKDSSVLSRKIVDIDAPISIIDSSIGDAGSNLVDDASLFSDSKVDDSSIMESGSNDTLNSDMPVLCMASPDGRVEISNSILLNFTSSFTIETWIYLNSLNGGEVIFNKFTSGLEDKFIGIVNSNSSTQSWFYTNISGTHGTSSNFVPTIGAWHHIAVVSNNASINMFIDGKIIATGSIVGTINNSNGPFDIGSVSREGLWHPSIDGCISEFRFSSAAKYSTNFIPANSLSIDSDTVSLWHINEGTGTTIIDVGIHQLNGTIQGAASWSKRPPRN